MIGRQNNDIARMTSGSDNANLRSRSFLRRDWWFRGAAAGWEPTKQRRRGGFAPKRLRRESKRRFRKDKD